MAIKTRRSGNSEVDRLRRKADQQDELGSMAAADRDKEASEGHFAEARKLRAQARELELS